MIRCKQQKVVVNKTRIHKIKIQLKQIKKKERLFKYNRCNKQTNDVTVIFIIIYTKSAVSVAQNQRLRQLSNLKGSFDSSFININICNIFYKQMKDLNKVNVTQIFEVFATTIVQNALQYHKQYQDYQFTIVAILTALIFYRIGKTNYNKDSIEYKVASLNKLYESKQKTLQKEKSTKNIINFLKTIYKLVFLFGTIAQILFYSKELINMFNLDLPFIQTPQFKKFVKQFAFKQQRLFIHFIFVILMLSGWKIMKLYQKYVSESTKKRYNDLDQMQRYGLDQFIKSLGIKSVTKIKNKICADFLKKLNAQTINSANNCKNQKCKEQRKFNEKYYDLHRHFLRKAFDFKWCELCLSRRKVQLDLSSKNVKTEFDSQKEKVEYQLNQLVSRCSKLKLFFDGYCRSGCGFRYWKLSRQIKQSFKTEKTEILSKLTQIEKRKKKY